MVMRPYCAESKLKNGHNINYIHNIARSYTDAFNNTYKNLFSSLGNYPKHLDDWDR